MCGIAGFWQAGGLRADDAISTIRRMTGTIHHRGPDDGGEHVDAAVGLALGFRRLAILDLTPLGHQPMRRAGGRFTVTFNGEIYNHHELRAALGQEGVTFAGRSDTEALCAGFDRWGVKATLERAAGMFAIAAWDHERQELVLARDRMGIKPLYMQVATGGVAWGSELKPLMAGPWPPRALAADALDAYLSLLYVPGPTSIFGSVTKVPAGTLVRISDPVHGVAEPEPFWSLTEVARAGRLGGHGVSEAEAPVLVEETLTRAVGSHLESDVPLGAFLSGGIDSTTVVALMQRSAGRAVRTFTVQFDDPVHDEAAHAEAVARHLGTEHATLPVTGADALALVPRLCEVYDEPFADASQLPSLLVSAAARRHVTVVLTGDGGDELFAGYNRYLHGARLLGRLDAVPRPVRRAASALIDAAPAGSIDALARTVGRVPGARPPRLAEEKARKLGRLLGNGSAASRYHQLVAPGLTAAQPRKEAPPPLPGALAQVFAADAPGTLLDRMLLADQLGYLPDNQMTKVDRASMAVSLEARVPLLDHRVVELAWRLPASQLVRGGVGKRALRDLVYRHVPRALLDRPKTGFSVPLGPWLRGPLRPWVEETLAPEAVKAGPLDPSRVTAGWRRVLGGHDAAALAVWAVLMFEAWRRRWVT
jgi:asparagine synthase (glutamine-hydrolysing)